MKNGSWKKDLGQIPLSNLAVISSGILFVLFVLFKLIVKKPKKDEKQKKKEKW